MKDLTYTNHSVFLLVSFYNFLFLESVLLLLLNDLLPSMTQNIAMNKNKLIDSRYVLGKIRDLIMFYVHHC